MKHYLLLLSAALCLTFDACNNSGNSSDKDKDKKSDSKEETKAKEKTYTEKYIEGLQGKPETSDKASKIISRFSPFKIVNENGKDYLVIIEAVEESLKKYPMDTILNRTEDLWYYSDYDKFNVPGDLVLTDFYAGKHKKEIEVNHLELKPDVKDTPCKVFFANNSDNTLTKVIMTIKVTQEKDTLATEKAEIKMKIPPHTLQGTDFRLSKLSQNSFSQQSMLFSYSYIINDFTLE